MRLILLVLIVARVFALTRRAAYGTPTDPVAGTVITVAYAVANVLDPIRALRAFTGGADPPGTGYVVESTSTTSTSWVLVNAAKIASWLGYTPLNKAGDTITNNLAIGGNLNIGGTTTAGPINGGAISGSTGTFSGAVNIGGTTTAGPINGGAISGSTGTFSGALSALSAAITNAITAATATISGLLQANQLQANVATGTAPLVVSSTTEVANLNAAALSGNDWHAGLTGENTVGTTPTTSYVDISNCSVTLDRAGTWLILAVATISGSSEEVEIRTLVNGVAQTPTAIGHGIGGTLAVTISSFAIVSASSGHVAKLQLREVAAGISNQMRKARIAAIWLAP